MATRKPAKGKAKVKITSSGKKISYGQAGKAIQSKHDFYVCLLAHFDPFKFENLRFETKFSLEMFLGLGLWLNQIGM